MPKPTTLWNCPRATVYQDWGSFVRGFFNVDIWSQDEDIGAQMMNIKYYDAQDFPTYLPKLNALYDDLFAYGKGFRSQLIQKISGHLKLDDRQVLLLAQTIEFIHNASLLHDDLIDRSALRRNKPAAWLKYTPEYAVLAGDYLLARVMVNLSRYGNLRLIQYTAEIISNLLEGEWIQDSLIQDFNIELQQLDRVHNLKTASLFKWCIRAPFICHENYDGVLHSTLEELGLLIGLLFQRSDDLLDFDVRNYEKKAVLGDLKSGYLNSFGSFLCEGFSPDTRDLFKKCESLDDVHRVLGEGVFAQKLEAFDKVNQNLIDLYEHHALSLRGLLPDSHQGLVDDLLKLPKPLYWRKS